MSDDTISRQKAIDAIKNQTSLTYEEIFNRCLVSIKDENGLVGGIKDAIEALIDLPSADAVEIVRCKDCRWWDKSEDSPFGYCMAIKHGYMSANWEIGIYRKYKGDFYCADGERKEE